MVSVLPQWKHCSADQEDEWLLLLQTPGHRAGARLLPLTQAPRSLPPSQDAHRPRRAAAGLTELALKAGRRLPGCRRTEAC